jgi:hypothetical protein
MPSAEMTRLMDHCRVRLPGALDAAIKQEMGAVFDEFLSDSGVWFEDIAFVANPTLDTYEQNPAAYTYPLNPTAGAIVRLSYVTDLQGGGKQARMPTIPNLVLVWPPSNPESYKARVVLTNDAVDVDGYPIVPDWIVRRYATELLDGVLGRMMSQISKPYTSPANAMVHMRVFKSAVQKAKVDSRHEHLFGAQRWRFPQTFNRAR